MSVIDYSWDFSKEEFSLDLDFFNEKEQEDKLWQARTGLNHETLCGAIETIIFMSDKPVHLLKIKNQIDSDIPLRVVHESIARLQTEYEAKHHGIRLMEVAQGYQFRTKATYAKIIQNMYKVQSLQLSPTALEVLAMIAYKQPISKTGIETVRGVDSSHVVRALMDRRLVRIVGRSDEAGRPSLYGTSQEFLEIFNLNSIDDLPSEIELEELASANEVGQISDIRNIIKNVEKKIVNMDELLELDELSSSIQSITSETLFTKSLKDMDKVRKSDEGVEKKSAFDILEEYVNKAQIIEQNKTSIESDVLTSVMEPKSVSIAALFEGIINAPLDEDLEEENEPAGELDMTRPDADFEELDTTEANELEIKATDILEKSNELLESLINDPETAIEAQASKLPIIETLEEEIESAFDNLLGETETTQDIDAMDISSFIAAKIASAQVENVEEVKEMLAESVEVSIEASSEVSEEQELEDALDLAFENLTFDSGATDSNATNSEDTVDLNDIDMTTLAQEFTKDSDFSKLE